MGIMDCRCIGAASAVGILTLLRYLTVNNGRNPHRVRRRGITGTLGRLFALSEAYPDLKANTTMLSLMEELTSTENKVSFARQAYNDSVMAYNTQREVFPSSVMASTFQFTAAELFVIEKQEQRQAPQVSFASGT